MSLSADAGDEFFGGYTKYSSQQFLYKLLLNIPNFLAKPAGKIVDRLIDKKLNNFKLERLGVYEMASNILSSNQKEIKQISKIESCTFSDAEIRKFMPSITQFKRTRNGDYSDIPTNNIETLMLHDVQNYMLHDILKKVDMSTMSKSLEGREPFLDHNLFEFLAKLDPKTKFYGTSNKAILRDLVYEYVPKEIIDLPKRGFGAPLKEWSKRIITQYSDFLYVSFNEKEWSTTYLDYLIINSEHNIVLVDKLWVILNYLLWEQKYIDHD